MRILIVVEGGVVQHILAAHQSMDDRGFDCEPEELQIFLKDYDESEYRSDCKPSELPIEFIQNFQFDEAVKEKF